MCFWLGAAILVGRIACFSGLCSCLLNPTAATVAVQAVALPPWLSPGHHGSSGTAVPGHGSGPAGADPVGGGSRLSRSSCAGRGGSRRSWRRARRADLLLQALQGGASNEGRPQVPQCEEPEPSLLLQGVLLGPHKPQKARGLRGGPLPRRSCAQLVFEAAC